jgi:hypothetical protein
MYWFTGAGSALRYTNYVELPQKLFFLENFNKKNLEALHVDNAWTGFIILSLGDPHLPTQSPIVKELKME